MLLPALLLALVPVLTDLADDRRGDSAPPATLAAASLDGRRTVKGPVCIDQANDVSGSMDRYAAERDAAVDQMLRFANRELRPDDMFAEAVFAGSGQVTLPPTSLHAVGHERRPVAGLDPGTRLAPAIDALSAGATGSTRPCASKALVVVTDGLLFDEPGVLEQRLGTAGYSRAYLMVPGVPWQQGGEPISTTLPRSITVRYFTGPDELGVAFGEVAAALTGERLTTRKKGTQ